MNIVTVFPIVISVVSIIISVIALFQSHRANRIATEAKDIDSDNVAYEWEVAYDDQTSTITITNTTPHNAAAVAIYVQDGTRTLAEAERKTLNRFQQVLISDQQFKQELQRRHDVTVQEYEREHSLFPFEGKVKYDVVVYITYTTYLGRKFDKKIELQLHD